MGETPKLDAAVEDDNKVKPEEVVTADIVEAIAKGANEDWVVIRYDAKMGTQLGDNFMSVMYWAGIDVKSKVDETVQDKLHVMVKTMPKNAARVQMINDCGAFVKEVKMYEEVLPAMVKFQKECGIDDKDIFKPWPKVYASRSSEAGVGDYVALQDLKPLKFGMACRHQGLGFEESKLVLRSLGKFHAISYAKYQGDFDRLKAAYPYLDEKLFQTPELTPEFTKDWLRQSFTREAQMIRDKNPADSVHADAVGTLFNDTFWAEMHRITSSWTKVAVIGHADCWTNNFLFQFDQHKKAVDLNFVDFQLCRVGSRCLDLGYFMYTSPLLQILNEHEDEMLAGYFEAFKEFATKLGYFDNNLTFDQLKQEYNDHRVYGISIGLMLAPIISAKSGDIPDMETMSEDMSELMSEDNMEMWFGTMNKEKAIHDKVLNIAKNHIPKVRK